MIEEIPKEDMCPYCASDNLKCNFMNFDSDATVYKKYTCQECKGYFDQLYSLNFTGKNLYKNGKRYKRIGV